MATWIYVCCRSEEPVTYAELEDVMGHMGWLDQPVKFSPPVDERNGRDPRWDSFHVEYRPNERPIVVDHRFTSEEIEPALSDIREQLERAPDSNVTSDVSARLDATKQMFVFEVPGDPPEDVWLMLAQGQAFLARERDGIVVAEEGVYDAELNVIISF